MDPCNGSSSPINQTSQNNNKDKKQIKKTSSLLHIPETAKNPRNLKGRVSKNTKNIRHSISPSSSFYEKPTFNLAKNSESNAANTNNLVPSDGPIGRPSFDFGEYKIGVKREDLEKLDSNYKTVRHIAPIDRKNSTLHIPNILERLDALNAESLDGKLKRTGDYALTYISTNILYWKEIDKVFLLGFIGERKAKIATKEALEYILKEIKALLQSDQIVSYPDLISSYDLLKGNKICQQVFKENPELMINYATLLKQTVLKKPS